MKEWLNEIDRYATQNVNKLLVGNKLDLDDKRAVSTEEAEAFAKERGIPFLETSAKDDKNVDAAFMRMAKEIKGRMAATPQEEPAGAGGSVRVDRGHDVAGGGGGGCC